MMVFNRVSRTQKLALPIAQMNDQEAPGWSAEVMPGVPRRNLPNALLLPNCIRQPLHENLENNETVSCP